MSISKSYNIEKSVIVLLHYFGGDKGSWQWLIDESIAELNLIPLDIAGFGNKKALSEITLENIARATFKDIIKLGYTNITVVGHSMSGKLALKIGVLDTENVIKSIILLAPSPPTVEKMSKNEQREMLKQQDIQRAKNNVQDGIYTSIDNEKFEYAVQSQLRVDSDTWNWWINEGMKNNILDEVKNLKQDVHLIYSTKDNAIPFEDMKSEVIDNLKLKSIYKFEDSGHLIPLERPAKLAEIITNIVLS